MFCLRNSRAAGKRLIAHGRLPVPGRSELRTIEELRSTQASPGKVGAVDHSLEKVRSLQMGPGQVRPAQVRSPEIGIPKIHPGEVKSAQIEPSQTGPR